MSVKHEDQLRSEVMKNDAALEECWSSLISLNNEPISLNKLFSRAEKILQYHRVEHADDIEQLRPRIEARQRVVAAEIATGAADPQLMRLRAVLAGAHAGCIYPLGWSPRDLNLMAF